MSQVVAVEVPPMTPGIDDPTGVPGPVEPHLPDEPDPGILPDPGEDPRTLPNPVPPPGTTPAPQQAPGAEPLSF